MFLECTNLSNASGVDLSGVKKIGNNCFALMFYGCIMLGLDLGSSDPESCIPKLPESDVPLSKGCYNDMFYGCIEMVKAPDIVSASAEINALNGMFYGCSKLESIKVAFMSDPDDKVFKPWIDYEHEEQEDSESGNGSIKEQEGFKSWTGGVKPYGTIYVPAGSTVSELIPYKGEPGEWTKVEY
jgi:hypothetical protein